MTETFKIPSKIPPVDRIGLVEVQGERISVCMIPCFIFWDRQDHQSVWNVAEVETGMMITTHAIRETAIDLAAERLRTDPGCIQRGKMQLLMLKISIPVNV